ncbi:MAG: U32 family peptidase, partial [Bacteroidales bacterium]|nr:U32 family peptidase [Bacteroidales bacterium]
LNTLFYDHEIEMGIKTAFAAYEAGVDALIIQDFGLIEAGLPPLPLHASTQMHNYSLERVQFLEASGFSRAVLPREMSKIQISDIAKNTNIELEYFIHGALCVSYSGQCYMSAYLGGRSANRGNCAQPCRLPYDVLDDKMQIIDSQKHVLSLKDLNLEKHIPEILDAGVMSLKIEGRLKSIPYVTNIVSHYRKILDQIIENNSNYHKASTGKTIHSFVPNPNKTFNRGYTNLNFSGRVPQIYNPLSPKSLGEFIGIVTTQNRHSISIDTKQNFSNGDGLCYFDSKGNLQGFTVYKVEENTVFGDGIEACRVSSKIYRNKDVEFEKTLTNERTKRLISIDFQIDYKDFLKIKATDEEGHFVEYSSENKFEIANDTEKAQKTIEEQFSKTGDTIFSVNKIDFFNTEMPFVRISDLNKIRREILQLLLDERTKSYTREEPAKIQETVNYPEEIIEKSHNVLNKYSKTFLEKRGAKIISMSAELNNDFTNLPLMTTHHCLRFEYGHCEKYPNSSIQSDKSPAFLQLNQQFFKLKFDCKSCVMKIEANS